MFVNFYEAAANFELPPHKAIEFVKAKGLKKSFSWLDMLGDEHDAAFTVAKMMDTDLLAMVQGRVNKAIASGTTLDEFRKELIPELQKAGWWGKKDVIDPKTGRVVKAQLGSASRLETIFRTNLQSAYSVGRWDAIQENRLDAPYLMYDAVDDNRTRPDHAALDGKVLPVNHIFWDEFAPPNGWNCRCGIIQMNQDDLDVLGLSVSQPPIIKRRRWTNPRTGKSIDVPENLDPGWHTNPGKRRAEKLRQYQLEKERILDPHQRAALSRSAMLHQRRHDQLKAELATQNLGNQYVKPAAVSALVGGAAFDAWLAHPEGFFPIGTIGNDLVRHLGVSSNVVDVSDTTINTKLAMRPQLRDLWKQIPTILRDGTIIDVSGRIEVFYRDPVRGVLYRLGIKSTSQGEVLVTTLYREKERKLRAALNKGEVIQKGKS